MPHRGPPVAAAGGPRYLLRPSVEPFVDRHGTLCFVRPGGEDLVVRSPDPVDVALVHRLRTNAATAEELAHDTGADPSEIDVKLRSLVAADLVLVRNRTQGVLSGDDAERFSRQLPYLAELGDEVAVQQRLRASKLVVLGCGGLGTWALAALACIGVGSLVLVDDDRVALSNLNRQILYARSDVGVAKVNAAAAWARAFDPTIAVSAVERRLTGVEDVSRVVSGADAVVLAADQPPYDIGRWVNAACVDVRIPFIVAGQIPPVLKVGPTYIPGEGPCFACHEAAVARESLAYEDYVAFRTQEREFASTLGPGSCVAGGLMALELMHLLSGHVPVTRDRALILHMRTLEVRHEAIPRQRDCPACKHLV